MIDLPPPRPLFGRLCNRLIKLGLTTIEADGMAGQHEPTEEVACGP